MNVVSPTHVQFAGESSPPPADPGSIVSNRAWAPDAAADERLPVGLGSGPVKNQRIPAIAVGVSLLASACSPSAPHEVSPILLFNGTGTSPNDVKAIEAVLQGMHQSYTKVDSQKVNGMPESQWANIRLLIVPGGNYLTLGNSLSPTSATNIHHAVQGGMNYLGICAGGLLAGNATSNSPNLTSGVRVGFYSAVNQGIHKAAVRITIAGIPDMDHYWEDGPQFAGWGEVVGKYPDGTPAVVEGNTGKGWVILCGFHPEAPEAWRRGMTFTTPASQANAYAGTLIDAALNGTRLPHF